MVVGLTALVGLASSSEGPASGRLLLALVAMLLSQLAIGWSNDYLDRGRDTVHQPDKPLPAGLVPAEVLPPLVIVSLVGSAGSAAALGAPTLAFLIAGTSAGFAYNFVLKDTRWSWLAYIVGFGSLPPFVWTALDSFRSEFVWLYPLGAPLVVAVHVANTLPDIEADAAAGARGLVVRLGRRQALVLLFACLMSPLVVILPLLFWLDYDLTLLGATLALYAVLLVFAAAAYARLPFPRGAALGFRLVAPACVLLAAGWLASL